MSEYSERVRDSDVVSNLRQAETNLQELEARGWEHQSKIDLIDRIKFVTTHVLGRLTFPDSGLITETTLQDLRSHSESLLAAMRQIESLPLDDESDNRQINSTVDDLLRAAANLPALPFRTTPAVVEKAAEQFSREAKSAAGLISERFNEVQSQIAEKSNEVQSQLNGVRTKLDEVSHQSETILAQTQETMTSQIAQIQSEANSLHDQVRSAENRLEAEVSQIRRSFAKTQSDNEFTFTEAQESRQTEYHVWFSSSTVEIENLRDQAKSMLEEVAGSSTAEHYAKQHDKQNEAADRWRRVGVGSLIALVSVTVGLFVHSTFYDSDVSLALVLMRSSVPVSLLILATYALRQSGHHRQREEDVSRVSNELMLLWPFMNRLPEEDRQSLLRDITPLYFKGGLSHHDAGDRVGWTDRMVDTLTRRNRT